MAVIASLHPNFEKKGEENSHSMKESVTSLEHSSKAKYWKRVIFTVTSKLTMLYKPKKKGRENVSNIWANSTSHV